MKFADPMWLGGTGFALVVAALLVAGAFLLVKAMRRFGDEGLVTSLVTGRAGPRRVLKGVLLVIAVAFGFLALAQPQYGRGSRLIPATNLDVIVVLDYSKSMYARDVTPSRIIRAQNEVGRLIAELPGARFGAVAFAGEPMSFPLTSDGGAISQFFRQLSPNDMPVGGTAIGRALESGRDLLARDPLSKNHRRVLVLVTDGEDLEGDPVSVAQAAKADSTTIHVVQIGGRTPEPIPDVNAAGEAVGIRTDDQGKPITTSLSAEGEAQLAKLAEVTGGRIVRSARGETGLGEVTRALKRMMTEELSEKVEIVYADVYAYPLALAILLLVIEALIPETRRRERALMVPPPKKPRRRRRARAEIAATTTGAVLMLLFVFGSPACNLSIDDLFTRNSPAVDNAVSAYDAGDASAATSLLAEYLSTGKCEKGSIGTPESVKSLPHAAFDLGLALFRIAEGYGQRFGKEPEYGDAGPTPEQQARAHARDEQVDCALRVVRAAMADPALPVELRAKAYYLAGNLDFLRGEYKQAVADYELALRLIPGTPPDAGDPVGADAAWNRAVALERIKRDEDKKRDAGKDGSPNDQEGGTPDSGSPDSGHQNKDGGGQDQKPDAGKQESPDAGSKPQPKAQPDAGQPDAGPPPPQQSASRDDELLDELERAPTLDQEQAKRSVRRRVVGAEDK